MRVAERAPIMASPFASTTASREERSCVVSISHSGRGEVQKDAYTLVATCRTYAWSRS